MWNAATTLKTERYAYNNEREPLNIMDDMGEGTDTYGRGR